MPGPLPLSETLVATDNLVPLAVIVVAIILLMSSLRRRQRLRAQEQPRNTPFRSPTGDSRQTPERQLRNDLESLLVELQELSRKISAQIDTRFAKLEAAIRDADRRIAALNRLGRQAPQQTGGSPHDPAETDIRHGVVYELTDAGFTPVEIAKDLGKTVGEVELILNLRKKSSPLSPPARGPGLHQAGNSA